MKQTPKFIRSGGLILALMTGIATVSAAAPIVQDTIAGLGTDLQISSDLKGLASVIVQPPYGPETVLDTNLDNSGTAVRIPGDILEEAGEYTVYIEQNGQAVGESASFLVEPDSIDPTNSTLQVDRQNIDADGWDEALVQVILRDQYGNPLSQRPVQLVSNRAGDSVIHLTDETDESGQQDFAVSTTMPGSITLRAIDMISGTTIPADVTIQAGSTGYAGNSYLQSNLIQQPSNGSLYQGFYNPPTVLNQVGPYNQKVQMVGTVAGQPLFAQVAGTEFGVVESFSVEIPATTNIRQLVTVTIKALDRSGNVVQDYAGSVSLATTDVTATTPFFDITFQGRDLGVKTLPLSIKFGTPGEHIVQVNDTINPDIKGASSIFVDGDGGTTPGQGASTIKITAPTRGSIVSGNQVLVEGEGPKYINLIVRGGQRDVQGNTDGDGKFSISVPLDTSKRDQTLRVQNEFGNYDSGNIDFKLDSANPTISEIRFSPQRPEVGDDIQVNVVLSDDGQLPNTISGSSNGQQFTLTRQNPGGNTYQGTFSISTSGTHEVVINAADGAGNTVSQSATIEVKPQGLPQVKNLRAESEARTIKLEWDPVEGQDIDGYRIYIGDAADNLFLTRDTNSVNPRVTLAELQPSATYFFAVTAVYQNFESEQKSNVTSATVEGVTMTIRPEDGTLILNWNKTLDETLSGYELLYGISPDALTEKRMISGDANSFTLRDLLNDVTYYLMLTPIAVNGDRLEAMIVEGQGTPVSAGDPSIPPPSSSAPSIPYSSAPSSYIYSSYSSQPPVIVDPHGSANCDTTILGKGKGKGNDGCELEETGLPGVIWWTGGAILLFACYFGWQQQRQAHAADTFFQHMKQAYHTDQ